MTTMRNLAASVLAVTGFAIGATPALAADRLTLYCSPQIEWCNLMVEAFEKVDAFWSGRNEAAAMELSTKALEAARRFQEAGGAGNFDAAAEAFGTIRSTCMPCHQQYRERTEGGYRIKQGS